MMVLVRVTLRRWALILGRRRPRRQSLAQTTSKAAIIQHLRGGLESPHPSQFELMVVVSGNGAPASGRHGRRGTSVRHGPAGCRSSQLDVSSKVDPAHFHSR